MVQGHRKWSGFLWGGCVKSALLWEEETDKNEPANLSHTVWYLWYKTLPAGGQRIHAVFGLSLGQVHRWLTMSLQGEGIGQGGLGKPPTTVPYSSPFVLPALYYIYILCSLLGKAYGSEISYILLNPRRYPHATPSHHLSRVCFLRFTVHTGLFCCNYLWFLSIFTHMFCVSQSSTKSMEHCTVLLLLLFVCCLFCFVFPIA